MSPTQNEALEAALQLKMYLSLFTNQRYTLAYRDKEKHTDDLFIWSPCQVACLKGAEAQKPIESREGL